MGAVEPPERLPLFLISLRHRINLKWVREGFSKTDEELIQSYIEAKEEIPLFIEDIFLAPPDELFEKIVLYRKSYNPDLVVIDSIMFLSSP